MKPMTRCMRYSEEKMSAAKASGSNTTRPPKILRLNPPSHSVHMAMERMTTNAPMSGSNNSNAPTKAITANIGRKGLSRWSFTAPLRTA
jgi:hypothetical protein